ncbi:MAG: hypothetical protein A2381_00985 [Bdellovibrionales bacterium RIFOXYB1_FULL_37_110]|nr:MAG: hypothetical protein A2417_01840 [Bdellovibrionales bacterium RIFOXYC1_FULL_37_79]OFZ58793.1 MAG: hypothetical protein A2381_00985 [Bdellovibrionales bacterium RIFOXYB1_FULL_37_110]OFZ64792.1 MAG: hypothetical protein A2577_06985 [Bdellovibrionales bacterium RIFOXYD1_FULL_36_51]
MSNTIIKVENLSKRYVIKHQNRERYTTLRDVITNTFNFSNKKKLHTSEEFWAVNNLSFNIGQGERLGIIGRNGAGKSTLLKLISRITEPTMGKITLNGRVASLLEIGTGFHPELTGRENIFLNGAVLGMRRLEIKKKFDEIVSFAEIEQFLDTPVKRYSSGMYVRLAFAVAAHLEPEILIVDEVLAVGDAHFQKKCLGKMEDVGKEGRTVLFVSHNMMAIRQLCPRCILIDQGKLIIDDKTNTTINHYNQISKNTKIDEKTHIHNEKLRRGEGAIRFTKIEITNALGESCPSFKIGESIFFKMSYKVFKIMDGVKIHIALKSGISRETVTNFEHILLDNPVLPDTEGDVTLEIAAHHVIRSGEYPLYFHLADKHDSPASIDVVDEVTLPLVISEESDLHTPGIPMRSGCFSVPSRIIESKIHSPNHHA